MSPYLRFVLLRACYRADRSLFSNTLSQGMEIWLLPNVPCASCILCGGYQVSGGKSRTGCNLRMAESAQDWPATLEDCRGEFSRRDL